MTAETLPSTKIASTVTTRGGTGIVSVSATYEIAEAIEADDIFQMVKVPKGARIVDITLATDALDSGTDAIVLAVGDVTTADRFITGSTVGYSGGIAKLNQVDGMGYVYPADDTIDVTCTTGPDSGTATGTISLTVVYDMCQA